MATLMLDPGHGGKYDPGTVHNGIQEKDLNLEVAIIAKNYLEKAGVKVLMTRHQDTAVSLESRCHLSNMAQANLFVSIHHNAANRVAKGFEIYHYENSVNGIKMAKLLEQEYAKHQTKRYVGDKEMAGSVSEWNYYVLENTFAPAILSEFCFIDNPEDFKRYNPYVEAECIARAVCNYFGVAYPEPVVPDKHWAEVAYQNLTASGIIINEKRFDDKITRGEVFALLAQLIEKR